MNADLCPPREEFRVINVTFFPLEVESAPGYGASIFTTSLGPAILKRWCVWIEPIFDKENDRWNQRWYDSVDSALTTWEETLTITRVKSPGRAHVRLIRKRPPLRKFKSGLRASNGRSFMKVLEVKRQGRWSFEPSIDVLVSPDLRAPVLQATALHELGHAFGLWGHSDEPFDVMAVSQRGKPLLSLTSRDLCTLKWLSERPNSFGQPSLIRSNRH